MDDFPVLRTTDVGSENNLSFRALPGGYIDVRFNSPRSSTDYVCISREQAEELYLALKTHLQREN